MIRLTDPKDGKILFEGDPNADSQNFRDALRLVPEARLAALPDSRPLPLNPDPPREVAFAMLFAWGLIGLIAVGCALGVSVRLFLLISGV